MANSYFIYGGKNFYSNNNIISNNNVEENLGSRFKNNKTFNTSTAFLTQLGITDSNFTIIDEGTEFSTCTHIFTTNTNDPSDITKLELTLKLNSESISGIATDMFLNSNFTPSTFYLVLTDYSSFLSGGHSTNFLDIDNCDGIISFDVNNVDKSLSNPTIVQAGKFVTTYYSGYPRYDFNCEGRVRGGTNVVLPSLPYTPYTRSDDIFIPVEENLEDYKANLASCKVYLAPIATIDITPDVNGLAYDSSAYESTTGGYYIPLDATFKVKRAYSDLDATLSSSNAVLSASFKLNRGTVIISGGSNYAIGDTFTSDDGAATTVATHTVNNITKKGGIMSTTLTHCGLGFTSEPTVTYNGSTGSGATVKVNNNNYSVSSITVISGGNGYCSKDSIEVRNASDQVLFDRSLHVSINVQSVTGTDIKLNDKMSLENIRVVYPGNNFQVSSAPPLQLYNLKTKSNIDNTSTYVTSNADNFIVLTDNSYLLKESDDQLILNGSLAKGYETNVSRTFYYPTDTELQARHRPITNGYAEEQRLKTYIDKTHD